MIYIAAFTDAGAELAKKLGENINTETAIFASDRIAEKHGVFPIGSLKQWCADIWSSAESIIFVGAAGIAVRAIAPNVETKTKDPAVVVTDERGQYAVSLLSGHIGGGNDLAKTAAQITGGVPVITTATDVNGKFAPDVFAKDNGLFISSMESAKKIAAAIVAGENVGLVTEFFHDPLPAYLKGEPQTYNIEVAYSGKIKDALLLIPKNIFLGIGCKRDTPEEKIESAVKAFLKENKLHEESVCSVASIDLKSDEAGLLEFAKNHGYPIRFYSPHELNGVKGDFSASDFVKSKTGVDCVCERAAIISSGGEALIARKFALDGVTVAGAAGAIKLKIRRESDT